MIGTFKSAALAGAEEVCYCLPASRGKILARPHGNMEKRSLDEIAPVPRLGANARCDHRRTSRPSFSRSCMRRLTAAFAAGLLVAATSAFAQQPLQGRVHSGDGGGANLCRRGRGLDQTGRHPARDVRLRVRPQHDPGAELGLARRLCRRPCAVAGGALERHRRARGRGHRGRGNGLCRRRVVCAVLRRPHAGAGLQGVPREERPSGQARHPADRVGTAHHA